MKTLLLAAEGLFEENGLLMLTILMAPIIAGSIVWAYFMQEVI